MAERMIAIVVAAPAPGGHQVPALQDAPAVLQLSGGTAEVALPHLQQQAVHGPPPPPPPPALPAPVLPVPAPPPLPLPPPPAPMLRWCDLSWELLVLLFLASGPAAATQLRRTCRDFRAAARILPLAAWLRRQPAHVPAILSLAPDTRLLAAALGAFADHWARLQAAGGPRPDSAAAVVAAVTLPHSRLGIYLLTPALRGALAPLPASDDSFSLPQLQQLLTCAACDTAADAAWLDAAATQQLMREHLRHMPQLLTTCLATPHSAACSVALAAAAPAAVLLPAALAGLLADVAVAEVRWAAARVVVSLLASTAACEAALWACLRDSSVRGDEAAILAAAPPEAIRPLWAGILHGGGAAVPAIARLAWRRALTAGASEAALLVMYGCVEGGVMVLSLEGRQILVALVVAGRPAHVRRVISLMILAGLRDEVEQAADEMPAALHGAQGADLDIVYAARPGVLKSATALLAACSTTSLRRVVAINMLITACSCHDVPMMEAMLAELPGHLGPSETHRFTAAMSALFNKHHPHQQAGPADFNLVCFAPWSQPVELWLLAMLTEGRETDRDCATSLKDITAGVKSAALICLVHRLLSPYDLPPPPPSPSSSAQLFHTLLSDLAQHASAAVVRDAVELVLSADNHPYTSLLLRPLCAALPAQDAEEVLLVELLRGQPRPAVVSQLASFAGNGGIASAILAALTAAAPAQGSLDAAPLMARRTSVAVGVVLRRIAAARLVDDAPNAHHVRLLELLQREPDTSAAEAAAVSDMLEEIESWYAPF